MNERIKKLEKQSLDYFWSLDDSVRTTDTFTANSEFTKKFAELIVRECDRYARSAWEHGDLLGRDLLIHFGVEV